MVKTVGKVKIEHNVLKTVKDIFKIHSSLWKFRLIERCDFVQQFVWCPHSTDGKHLRMDRKYNCYLYILLSV